MTSPDIQKEVLSETNNMPANKQVCEELKAETTDPAKLVVFQEMDYRKAYDYIYNAPNWFGEVQEGLTDYVSDKTSLDDTLDTIQNSIIQLQETY